MTLLRSQHLGLGPGRSTSSFCLKRSVWNALCAEGWDGHVFLEDSQISAKPSDNRPILRERYVLEVSGWKRGHGFVQGQSLQPSLVPRSEMHHPFRMRFGMSMVRLRPSKVLFGNYYPEYCYSQHGTNSIRWRRIQRYSPEHTIPTRETPSLERSRAVHPEQPEHVSRKYPYSHCVIQIPIPVSAVKSNQLRICLLVVPT